MSYEPPGPPPQDPPDRGRGRNGGPPPRRPRPEGSAPVSRRPSPGRQSSGRSTPTDADYNDIVWEDEDDKMFGDGAATGAIGISDYLTKKRVVAAVSIVLALILVIGTISIVRAQFSASGEQGAEITLTVPKGASLSSFASTLDEEGIVRSAFALKVHSKLNKTPSLQAGEYAFHKNSSPAEVIADIRNGPKQVTDKLVVPEGFRLNQIADRVGSIPGFSKQKFLDVAQSGTVRSEFQPAGSKNLEGFLFPDTYLLSSRDTEQTLLERMRNEFDNTARQLGLDRSARAIGRSPYETLVIASMVEAEAKVDADRGKISQVIENRLNAPMPLQIDATLLYALDYSKTSLSSKDLKTPGPYNTYLNNGLPPTPIGNPGRKSLAASLAPTPGPWLYYVVADAAGNHVFATNREEHDRNAAAGRAKGLF